MALQKKQLQSVSIWDMEPLMFANQTVGLVSQLSYEESTNKKGELTKYVKGLLADESGCVEFRFVQDKVIPLKENMCLRVVNFRAKFRENDQIYLTVDKYGNIFEDKEAKIAQANYSKNVSKESWEAKKVEEKE